MGPPSMHFMLLAFKVNIDSDYLALKQLVDIELNTITDYFVCVNYELNSANLFIVIVS